MTKAKLKELEQIAETVKHEGRFPTCDLDGSNLRIVTLAEFRADLDAAKARALGIAAQQRIEMASRT